MSGLHQKPDLQTDRQEFKARNGGVKVDLEETTEALKNKNVEAILSNQDIMNLHVKNAEFQKARENIVRTIRSSQNLAQKSIGNMT